MAEPVSSSVLASFEVRVRHTGETAHVVAVGELDMATAPHLQRELDDLAERQVRRVVLDLRGIKFFGSAGIAIVDRLDRRARTAGFPAAVVRVNPAVHRVLELAGLIDRLQLEDAADDVTRPPE